MKKKYITVKSEIDKYDSVTPKQIYWEDGRIFNIDRIIFKCRPAAHEFDGTRYTVRIGKNNRDIYLGDDGQWYIEAGGRLAG